MHETAGSHHETIREVTSISINPFGIAGRMTAKKVSLVMKLVKGFKKLTAYGFHWPDYNGDL